MLRNGYQQSVFPRHHCLLLLHSGHHSVRLRTQGLLYILIISICYAPLVMPSIIQVDFYNVLYIDIIFILFSFLLQLHTVSRIRYERFLACSQETMFYVNSVLVASFASRSLYQVLAMLDISTLPDVPLSVSIHVRVLCAAAALMTITCCLC